MIAWIAAVAAGAVAALGFAPLGWWPLTLGGIAVLALLIARAPTRARAAGLGWGFGVGHFTIGLNWIAGTFRYQDAMPLWLGWAAVVALAMYLAIYPAIATLAIRRLRGDAFPLAFGAAWIATEYARGTLFTGFAWNPLSAAMIDAPGVDAVRVLGTYGLSGLLVMVAAALATRRLGVAALGAAVVAISALVPPPFRSAPQPLVRVVQPNNPQAEKYDPAFQDAAIDRLFAQSGPVRATPRLILWPEAAVPWLLADEPWARARLDKLQGRDDAMIVGADDFVRRPDGRVRGAHNSAFVLSGDRLVARYDKAHLVPYGEYLPMRPLLTALGLSRLVPGAMDFLSGPGPRTLDVPGFGAVGLQICYEIVFSGEVADRARRPQWLFNPSNDAWFGAWGPPQQLAQARLRAIEEGLPVIRSTPTGISAIIDADGQVRAQIPLGRAGAIEARVPPPREATLFARHGNVVPMMLSIALALLAVASALRRA